MKKTTISNSEEHLNWSVEKIIEEIGDRPNLAFVSRDLKFLYENIKNRTSFLDEFYSSDLVNVTTRVNVLKLGIESAEQIPLCDVCGCKKKRILKKERTFSPFCSPKCERSVAVQKTKESWGENGCPLSRPENREKAYALNHSEEVKEKKKLTCIERYGVENPMHNKGVVEKLKNSLANVYEERGKEIIDARRKTCLTKYGVEHHMKVDGSSERLFETYKEKTGYSHPLQNPSVIEKKVKTIMERYGSTSPMHSKIVSDAIKATWSRKSEEEKDEIVKKRIAKSRAKFGVDNPSQYYGVKLKKKQTSLENYGVAHHAQHPDIARKISESIKKTFSSNGDTIVNQRKQTSLLKFGSLSKHISTECYRILMDKDLLEKLYKEKGGVILASQIGCHPKTVYRYLHMHHIDIDETVGTSFAERSIAEFVESLGVTIIRNDRTILDGKELDIFIPSHNLAIEYNGVFWHSTKFKSPRTHIDKTIKCESKGVRLIQIFEDEWNDRPDVIKRKIAMLLNKSDLPTVYARQCEIREIDNKMAKDFYNTYHIQGHANGSTVLGLYHNDVLVACMSFKINFGYMELIRFASNCRVTGGFSKLLKHFMKSNPDVDHIISFADRRWSDGNVYEKNGFQNIETIYPNYYYVVDDRRIKKQKFRHKYLAEMLEDYDPELSEKENTEAHDIWRIYDCGMFKYRIDNPFYSV